MDKYQKIVTIDTDRCDLCGTCVGICPENVMGLGTYRLSIDHEGCTRCSKCIWVCPVTALQFQQISQEKSAIRL